MSKTKEKITKFAVHCLLLVYWILLIHLLQLKSSLLMKGVERLKTNRAVINPFNFLDLLNI